MLLDTFTEASDTALESHTSDSGHTATRVVGSASSVVGSNGRLRGAATASLTIYTYDWVPPSANYYAQTANVAASVATGMRFGLRVKADGDGYFGFWSPTGNTYGITTRVGGVQTDQTAATSGAEDRILRLEIEDTTVRLLAGADVPSLAEVLAITVDPVADGLENAGSVGTHSTAQSFTATTRVQFDSLEADVLSSPPASGTNDELLQIRRRPMRGLVLRHT